ncbi:penicillin-binding protein 2 [bacterium endosymbiont of Bathymodiolus sp. 5 South]|jgi:penicillin-binding protein 2|uniref:penicillin-binding protein 2 n=1 Tax=bacterium endosymbiont of Bathymodiolus sp. 5 South TaxID=1181670 RepID=UPI0010AF0FB8|nr:penicillin-binding protein 2 [bacterium endosymbiont of Bathymodiolus sp. 5 South]VVH60124.1 Penicillin-binding protein 2 (PBP-2) [uncultured Gammaproteobacteria bacterium]SHN91779.1 Penicillin-binding protein 2 (PBP-2) [bacterium endosymbiont of Bathymodiolus sp. 5 South]SSC08284.1 Cell division protein FtsI [Peptidoglycan synthetase] [bacterium endosymbiont of Bathymodiolus sp. 5 South]VVH63904.1 Penicillin-binding protein 2 (PBP-2) [uncultured Gammaproteobacteria bacterium]VVM23048.1 Pen
MNKISNVKLENKIFAGRMVLALIFIFLLTLVLILRLFNLQIIHYDYYTEESLGNQMRILPITPVRGKIFDRHGKIIATNQLAYKLTLTPEKTKDIPATLLALKKFGLINDNNIATFKKIKRRYKKFHSIPLKHKLNEEQVAKFLVSNQFIGIDIEPYFHRVYPNNSSNVHVTGYVSRMNKKDKAFYDKKNYAGTSFVGKTGIEKQYETLLHGKSGKKQIERNVTGRVINSKNIQEPEQGSDLYLSIDLDLQKKAESLLKGRRGSIVAVDTTNGEVLVMVSTPIYNPNWFVDGISHKNYNKLRTSKDIPQLNRAIQGLYPPGSTIKPMVALAGLEQGVVTTHHKVYCPGFFKLPNVRRKFNDWKRSGHGIVDAKDSIAQSCDVYFYDLANKMGIDNLHDGLKPFNFGAITGIDIPGERGGILPSKAWKKINKNEPWYRGETLITGIGQGFMTSSPLQLAVATAALANQGVIIQPKLLKSIQAPGDSIKNTARSPQKQIPIKDIHNWEHVIEGMRQTIYAPKGTARRLNKNLKYTLAGKTGTAQVFGLDAEEQYIAANLKEHLRDHALFNGFAPIENPKIAIAVIVENAGSGSEKAAPLAKAVLDLYFEKQAKSKH